MQVRPFGHILSRAFCTQGILTERLKKALVAQALRLICFGEAESRSVIGYPPACKPGSSVLSPRVEVGAALWKLAIHGYEMWLHAHVSGAVQLLVWSTAEMSQVVVLRAS